MNEVIIDLGEGQIESGFRGVNIEFKQRGEKQSVNRCSLPPAPELRALLNQWQLLYPIALNSLQSTPTAPNFEAEDDRLLSPASNIGVFDDNTILNSSTQDIEELKDNFKQAIDNWLAHGSFRQIINEIRAVLVPQDLIVVTIVSERQSIWQLPWHFWDFFTAYPHAVELFTRPNFRNVTGVRPQQNSKVNILGVFGRDPKLKLSSGFLPDLPEVNPEILGKPEDNRPSLRNIGDRLAEFAADIFIFYGHGDTQSSNDNLRGLVYLDNDTPIEIERLRDKVKIAVDRGLQIAIFNCCSGLGLADRLSDVDLPYIIVMREQIPNQMAQSFLTDLLGYYSQGSSFPEAFGMARAQMILAEDSFAHVADWLPVLFHNPLSHHVTWQDLCQPAVSIPIPDQVVRICGYLSQPKRRIWTGMGASLLASILALSLQFTPPIAGLENWAIERFELQQASQVSPNSSQVTIVNYDELTIPGIVNNSDGLTAAIEQIERQNKPSLWILEINFERNNINGANILSCPQQGDGIMDAVDRNYSIYRPNCGDTSIVAELNERNKLPKVSQQVMRLNPYLLDKIPQTTFTQMRELSDPDIKQLFDRKFVLVGTAEQKSTARDALAIDRLIRANDPHQPISLFTAWENGRVWLWILVWSMLTAVAVWQAQWRFLVSLAIGLQLAIAWSLLTLGQGVPIAIGTLATIFVGTISSIVRLIANRRIPRRS
jgi:predicted RNase H-like HicB family nuclease